MHALRRVHASVCSRRDDHVWVDYERRRSLRRGRKDSCYYKTSGGGVTASGGEPLMQADFVAELFKRCRHMGIHTALETSGHRDQIRARAGSVPRGRSGPVRSKGA